MTGNLKKVEIPHAERRSLYIRRKGDCFAEHGRLFAVCLTPFLPFCLWDGEDARFENICFLPRFSRKSRGFVLKSINYSRKLY